jgi:hypothetical protein
MQIRLGEFAKPFLFWRCDIAINNAFDRKAANTGSATHPPNTGNDTGRNTGTAGAKNMGLR